MPGLLLLFRKKDGGRAGKIWVTVLVVLYWVLSTPIAAINLVRLLSPEFPQVLSKADARGATAIVLLGAGMHVHQSRGDSYGAPTREGSLRVLEAARVYRVLGGVPIIATGGHGSSRYSEAGLMAHQLEQLGVPAGRHHQGREVDQHARSCDVRAAAVEAAWHRAVRAGDIAAAHRPCARGISRRRRESGAVDP